MDLFRMSAREAHARLRRERDTGAITGLGVTTPSADAVRPEVGDAVGVQLADTPGIVSGIQARFAHVDDQWLILTHETKGWTSLVVWLAAARLRGEI